MCSVGRVPDLAHKYVHPAAENRRYGARASKPSRSLIVQLDKKPMASLRPGGAAGTGAAEEPEPVPGESPSSSTSTSYNPRDYQPAHPDDREGGGDGKPAKKGGKGTAKAKGKDDGHRCGNCDAPDAKRKCNGCGVEHYCGKECQAVRAGG